MRLSVTTLETLQGLMMEVNWQEEFEALLPKLFHYFCYRVGDPDSAEELTSMTFEKAWKNKEKFDIGRGLFKNWVFGIAKNVAAQHVASNKHKEVLIREDLFHSNGRPPEDMAQLRSEYMVLSSILAQLDVREQQLISLKYGAGFTNRSIAVQTGISETNIGTILHRAMKRIRTEWEKINE